MYGIKLLLALVVVAGIIAYVGDKIGMKVGRKRLSLFGLRPKHTSILVTVITGILIALTSLAFLIGASEGVRMAIFDMNALLARLDSLNQNLSEKNDKLQNLRSDIRAKTIDLKSLKEDRAELEEALSRTKLEYQKIGAAKVELEDKVEKLSLQKESLSRQVDNLAHNINFFGERYLSSLTEDIIYQKGEVIATRSIKSGLALEELKREIQGLLETAQNSAIAQGIQVDTGGDILEYNSKKIDKLYSILTDTDTDMIIRLLAAKNTLKNERLSIEFDLYEDYQVYQQGQVLLANSISLTNLNQLQVEVEEIFKRLREQGIRDGLLPNSKGELGKLNLELIYPLLQKLDSSQTEAQVEIRVVNDLYRADNLFENLELVISD